MVMMDRGHVTDLCMAGTPDDQGRGGCRAWDGRQPADLLERSRLCDWCLAAREPDVRALTLDYRDLEQRLPPALGVWGDGMPRGKSTPSPLRESVLHLQEEIWWLTVAWGEVARDVDRLSDLPTQVRAGWSVNQSVQVLAPRLRMLAEIEAVAMLNYPGHEGVTDVPGWQGVLDLARLHHRARSALGLTNPLPEHCEAVPCRACDLKLLYRIPGEDGVRCEACGLYYTAEEYTEWVALLAAHARGRSAA